MLQTLSASLQQLLRLGHTSRHEHKVLPKGSITMDLQWPTQDLVLSEGWEGGCGVFLQPCSGQPNDPRSGIPHSCKPILN